MASENSLMEVNNLYEPESGSQKLYRKSREAPFMIAGIGGALGGVIYGALKFKNRGQMSTSIYLIHLRVAAQGAVVSALTLGIGYTLLRDYVFNGKGKKDENST